MMYDKNVYNAAFKTYGRLPVFGELRSPQAIKVNFTSLVRNFEVFGLNSQNAITNQLVNARAYDANPLLTRLSCFSTQPPI